MKFQSLGRFRRRYQISVWEALIAVLAPVTALILRGVEFEFSWTLLPALLYCVASALCGVVGLAYVNISKLRSGYISIEDLLKTFKAAAFSAMAGVIAIFFTAHVHDVPRFVPIIQFFMFSGLITVLNICRRRIFNPSSRKPAYNFVPGTRVETQLLLGCGPLSVHYTALLDGLPQSARRIAGIVSICGDLVGSTLGKRIVLGPIEHFPEIVAEFKNHGVDIDRIVIAALNPKFQQIAFNHVSQYCEKHSIPVSFLDEIFGTTSASIRSAFAESTCRDTVAKKNEIQLMISNPYLQSRQFYDRVIAILLVTVLLPVLGCIAILTYLDVGRPILFWQQRVGRNGMSIAINKFRTLPHRGAHPVDYKSTPSHIGRFLQNTRLDELPQLFDIIAGRLSIIGPRPLLPRDLPHNTGGQESVLPGITGWAQVNGGKLISAEEKIALDYWYMRHASLWLDAVILLKTLRMVFRRREFRDEPAIELARNEFEPVRNYFGLKHLYSRHISLPPSSVGNGEDHDLVTHPSRA